jgi:hypothetical protein
MQKTDLGFIYDYTQKLVCLSMTKLIYNLAFSHPSRQGEAIPPSHRFALQCTMMRSQPSES